MNELHVTLIISLLALAVAILIWQSLVLARIARLLAQPTPQKTPHPPSTTAAPQSSDPASSQPSTPETDFDRFLAEDPQRQLLAKKEQAAAYREWRKQHGLTWNAGR